MDRSPLVRDRRRSLRSAAVCAVLVTVLFGCSGSPDPGIAPPTLAFRTSGAASALDGATVQGVVTVVVEDRPNYASVAFYLDDPQRADPPMRELSAPPYELELDTRGLSDGTHVLTAVATIGRGGRQSKVAASATFTVANAAPGPTPGPTPDTGIEIQAFYYPWYGDPASDLGTPGTNADGWRHWQQNNHTPPDDLGANFYPQLGPYSSTDPATLDQHMRWMKGAGIDVAIVSWWGQGSWEDAHLPAVLDAAQREGIQVAFHLEPYAGRTPATTVADIAYLEATYGAHPAFLHVALPTAFGPSTAARGVFYVFDVLASGTLAEWKSAMDALHAGPADALVLAQRVSADPIVDGHFDGVYTYDALRVDPTSFVDYAPKVAASGGVFAPSVGPGYDETRAIAGSTRTASREDGARYDRFWHNAIASGAPWITITSFNEWHEGTQIEPAVTKSIPGYDYTDYVGAYGTAAADAPMAYLDRTRAWVDAFRGVGPEPAPVPGPTPPPPPPPTGGTVTLAAAGDIACDPSSGSYNGGAGTGSSCHMAATADLLQQLAPDAVLTLGDNQYEAGTLAAYNTSYDGSWGALKSITRPSPGNHEYGTSNAAGYFAYFGAAAGDPAKGYYSYDLGSWHLVALNSNCGEVGGCGTGSPQETWLRADLAAHPTACTLAYWHHPRYSSGEHGDHTSVAPLWQALYEAGAEIVLSGHDHDYERFAPQDAQGTLDSAAGIRQFVVGTGGKNHYAIGSLRANSESHNDDTFGVLELTLRSDGYDWQFVPEAGGTFSDSGSAACH